MNKSSIQIKSALQVFQVPIWAFKEKNTQTTKDLFESLLLLSQSVVLSSEPLDIQRRQSGSILEALLYPLLHTDEDKNEKHRTHIMLLTELLLFEWTCPLRRWYDCVCAYSVMVVSRSLSLRFCSSSCVSFSRSCERVVSTQTSISRTFSWSSAACCSASRSWWRQTNARL